MKNIHRPISILALTLVLLHLMLVIGSWLITAAMPNLEMRSLLSSVGIRWFFGNYVNNLLSPLLAWLLLVAMAGGALTESGLGRSLGKWGSWSMQERTAMKCVLAEIIIFLIVMLLLTVVPHAVLLSVSGGLFPSSFTDSLVPSLSFLVCVCSMTYGGVCGRQRTLSEQFSLLTAGISRCAPLFVIYILAIELYKSLHFVFIW